MARPQLVDLGSGNVQWDGTVKDDFDILANAPIPIHEHSGDQTDLNSTFNAGLYDQCLVWVDHTSYGWTLYESLDSEWKPFQQRLIRRNQAITSTLTTTDSLVVVTAGGGTTQTLPLASTFSGRILVVKNRGAGTVTLDGSGAETIDGGATSSLLTDEVARLYSDGTEWLLL